MKARKRLNKALGRARLNASPKSNFLDESKTMRTLQTRTKAGQPSTSSSHRMRRRNFIKLAAGAVATSAVWKPLEAEAATKLEPLPRGIKVSLQISSDASDEDLQFAQQLGVAYVNIPTGGRIATLENFIHLKQRVEAAKLKVWNIGNSNVHNMPEVTRCIFGNFDGYSRALEIANSPNIGVCLCAGTWMEGGKLMGKDVFEAARAFAKLDKLWKIHFRNVSGPIPYFVETFVDNGYTDMHKLMKTLYEVDFRGAVIADHVPGMVGGSRTSWAYSIGYIKALFAAVGAEKG